MKKYIFPLCRMAALLAIILFSCNQADGQAIVTTVASSSADYGYAGDGAAATSSTVQFGTIASIAVDTAGNVFMADATNFRIRKVDHVTGVISTFVGDGRDRLYGDGHYAYLSSLCTVSAMCFDIYGNLYIYDSLRIRKVNHTTHIVSTVAGRGTRGFTGDGGAATAARIQEGQALYVDTAGNIFIGCGNRIRKVDASTGIIQTIAGDGIPGGRGDGGQATDARIFSVLGIAGDRNGNIYFTQTNSGYDVFYRTVHPDYDSSRLRKIDTAGIITNFAGGGIQFSDGCQASDARLMAGILMTDTSGNLLCFDNRAMGIKRIDLNTGIINTIYNPGNRQTGWNNQAHSASACDSRGRVYYMEYRNLTRVSGAVSALNTWTVRDTLLSAPCTMPAVYGFIVQGTINGVPSSTDSATITLNFADRLFYYPGTTRTYRLPYTYSGGTYTFGSGAVLDTFTYNFPKQYLPRLTLNSLNGYIDYYQIPSIMVGNGCATGITEIHTDIEDTFIASPCGIPVTVQFKLNGTGAYNYSYYATDTLYTPPVAGDSVYLVIDYGDGMSDMHVVPYDSSTNWNFNYVGNHTYTTIGNFYVRVFMSNSSGNSVGWASDDPFYPQWVPIVHIANCSGGNLFSRVTVDHNSACHFPDTVTYHCFGKVVDSAMIGTTSMALNLNYGDGSTEVMNVPIVYHTYLPYPVSPYYTYGGYTFDTVITHIFSMPGIYTSLYHDTAGAYPCDSIVNYGNSPSQLVIGSACSPLTGVFYIDSNNNCTYDTGEVTLGYWPYALVDYTAGDTSYGWCDTFGVYSLNVIAGDSFAVISDPAAAFSFYGTTGATLSPSCPSTGLYGFTATSGTSMAHDFAFTCAAPDTVDMSISGWCWGLVPGDTGVLSIWSSNEYGYMCDTLSSTVTLTLDSRLTYQGMISGPAPTSISGSTYTWDFSSSGSLFDFNAFMAVTTDTAATIFDTIVNTLFIAPTRVTDGDLPNNKYTWRQPVVSSWDPNEKQVSPTGYGPEGFIKNETPLSYMVHFQNTGSAPARNVTVVDTISADLDISTLQVIGSSHAVQVYHFPGNIVKFRFNNIRLIDSTTNPAQSVGYIAYNILPHHNLAAGTQITNTANIYFDYNPAVVTNSTINTIDDSIGIIVGPGRVCVGNSINLAGHHAKGTWSISNGRATISASGVVTGITPGLDTVMLACENGGTTTRVIRVDVFPTPTVSGVLAVCESANITLHGSDTLDEAWSVANTHASVVGGVVAGITAGPDTVYYSVTNSCGTASTSHLVTVNPLAHAGSISGSVTTICSGDSTAYIDTVSGAIWTSSNTSIATVGMFGMVHGTGGGTAIISVTVTNICNTDIATKLVHINRTPVAGSVYGLANICVAASAHFGDTTGTAGGAWYSANTSVASVDAAGLVYGVSPGTTVISYEIATATCGTAIATRSVTVNSLPYAGSISGSSNVCVSAGITLTSSGASAGGSWSSSTTSIGTIGTTSGVVTGVSAGNTTITYSVSTALCGSAFTTTPITVNALPVAGTITGGTIVCEGVSIALAHVSGTTSGSWSSSDTSSLRVSSTGTATGVTAGTATVTFTATTALCGSAYATHAMTIMPQPVTGTISGSSTVCPGSHTTLTDAATGGTWSASNGHATITGGVVSGITPGADTMYYTVTNSCGTRAARLPMTVATLPDAGSISGPAIVCLGTTVTLTDAATGGTWMASSTLATVSGGLVTGIATGSLTIYYSVTNVCGTATVPHAIDVLPNLTPSVTVSANPGFSVCTGDGITFTANGLNGGTAPGYIWTLNGTDVGSGSSYYYLPSAGDHLNCHYISNLACRTADTVAIPALLTIAVSDPVEPTIDITQSTTAVSAIGQVVVFNAMVTNGGTTPVYQWYVNGIAVSGATNAVFNYAVSGPSSVYCILTSNAPCAVSPSVTSPTLGVWADNTGVVNQDATNEEMSIFPNPNSGTFSVDIPTHNSDVVISITDAAGKTVKTLNITNTHQLQIPMDMTNVAAGVYMVRVETDGKVWRKKIVVM